ncbi:PREDICTED: uncharacterized protein LOC106305892 isoform X2 [Brassica oleracea var. oleracea]|uniref:Uncharacterized protein n=2 Tax=Brassica oleracea TaxID=3712 RepID=A0A0D3D566_BRAOL|nr:PREDICTED: uncharacterized protein LOC106305892 isoform X2 [Brassica oleracea var. oleracea]VDD36209.1 unnamed protein product [Brassica oleracea]
MMAAGEARAVWQRKVSRYLVQEDAKRAPKFTSSHSSSSSSTKQPNQKAQVKTPMEAGVDKHELGAKSFKPESFQELIETRESYGSFGKDESSEKHFDPTSPWNPLSSEKAGPWWRTTDKDELASLVAQRSLHFVENCDLPTPQKMKRSYYHGSSPHEHWPSSRKKRTEEASSESDLSKSELLEALRRSQTRAREAKNMAKEACAGKA